MAGIGMEMAANGTGNGFDRDGNGDERQGNGAERERNRGERDWNVRDRRGNAFDRQGNAFDRDWNDLEVRFAGPETRKVMALTAWSWLEVFGSGGLGGNWPCGKNQHGARALWTGRCGQSGGIQAKWHA